MLLADLLLAEKLLLPDAPGAGVLPPELEAPRPARRPAIVKRAKRKAAQRAKRHRRR